MIPVPAEAERNTRNAAEDEVQSVKIKLEIVLDAIQTADDAFTYFYDTQTEEVIVLSDLDSYDEREAIADAIDSDMNRYLRLPTKYEIHEYRVMEEFSKAYPDSRIRFELCNAIRGSGAFRRFKNVIRYHSIEQEWYNWRDKTFREIAVRWCKDRGLEYIE